MENILNLSKTDADHLLDLRKDTVCQLCLTKGPALKDLKCRVGIVLDFSGSMASLYTSNYVQALVEKLFPVALQFDDNGEMEVWLFDDTYHRLPNMTKKNYYGYIRNQTYKYKMGGTRYAPVINDVYKKYIKEEPDSIPNYIIFITDGDNFDPDETTKTIRRVSSSPIFWQFIGIGNSSFSFLENLDEMSGRTVDNANFFAVDDLNAMDDKKLYDLLLTEYPQWLAYPEVEKMLTKKSTPETPKKGFFGKLFSK